MGVMDALLNTACGERQPDRRGVGHRRGGWSPSPGLAAIPAVIAYNWYLSRIREIADELGHFSSELINVIIRERRV